MPQLDRQTAVLNILQNLRNLDGLKTLFWQELNYERQNTPLSTRQWPDGVKQALAVDPVLFATGGDADAFHIIYCQLASENLSRGLERPIVTRLVREHPYALIVFSDSECQSWHFVNVKHDDATDRRRVFRRITVRPGEPEQMRTAAERLQLLDLETIPGERTPLAIQSRCDEAFDVEAVTKRFYREIANWYFWALKRKDVLYPPDIEKVDRDSDKGRELRSIFHVRLLTRLIFCWFLREKGLVPADLFRRERVHRFLDISEDDGDTYYRAVLQNLFFATLNVPRGERKFISKSFRGRNKDYANQYVFRYDDEFTDIDAFNDLMREVPFLNAGLFECLDKKPDPDNPGPERRFDGFFKTRTKQARLPNDLFFGREHPEDLTAFYGDPKKPTKKAIMEPVRGLLITLSHYKFTVEENTPFEQDVALDPELLGKVFENCIYGVDIQPLATQIAKLRFFVSLIVDQNRDPSDPNLGIRPLPNLETKIVAADFLVPITRRHKQFEMFEDTADRILSAKRTDPAADTTALEREIDERVYRLYGLTREEIRIVEGEAESSPGTAGRKEK